MPITTAMPYVTSPPTDEELSDEAAADTDLCRQCGALDLDHDCPAIAAHGSSAQQGSQVSVDGIARINARIAELRAMEPNHAEGFFPITAAASVTANRIARAMLAMGQRPGMVALQDVSGAVLVECDAVDAYIDADGRVTSVVTLIEGDEDE
jgi:hypothetical protein